MMINLHKMHALKWENAVTFLQPKAVTQPAAESGPQQRGLQAGAVLAADAAADQTFSSHRRAIRQ